MRLNKYLANSTGNLTPCKDMVNEAFEKAKRTIKEKLSATEIDFIFVHYPTQTIPELGVGGYTPAPNIVYISLDPTNASLDANEIYKTILHEAHHAMRFRKPGYGVTLGEALISEGLATLFEEEVAGETPIYAKVIYDDLTVKAAQALFNSRDYNHADWFLGSDSVPRWFGYSYGYEICKEYSDKTGMKASELVDISAFKILASA